MKKVALYVRVSTTDKGQDVENQLIQLREYCSKKDYQIVKIYEDNETGKYGRKQRSAFDQMFKEAHQGKFDVLIIWALDRFSRQGPQMDFNYLKILDDYGVRFISYTQEYLSTENEFVRNILIALMSAFAKYEREMISERTKAGLARVKAKGVRLGKRPLDEDKKQRIWDLLGQGFGPSETARLAKVSLSTVKKYKAEKSDVV